MRHRKEDILYNQAYKEKYKKNSSKEATATPEVTEEPIAEDESTGMVNHQMTKIIMFR